MRKLILPLVISGLYSGNTLAEIIISEVVEGSGYNKAIELANVGATTISLDNYSLLMDVNMSGQWANEYDLQDITLDPFETYVIVHNNTAVNEGLKALADEFRADVVNFNGDDPIALLKEGSFHDVFGLDPETHDRQDFNKDVTFKRMVYTPLATWDPSQWLELPKDNWEDLGNIDENPSGPTPPDDAIKATIMELQGDGPYSPFTNPPAYKFESNEVFAVTGVVTAIQTLGLSSDLPVGFFMQDQHGDNNPMTSEGIFVPGFTNDLNIGDEVIAYGPVFENYYWTQLKASFVEQTGNTGIEIEPITIVVHSDDENFSSTLERHENMLVRFADESDMRVTRTFGFDYGPYRNNMVIAHKSINTHPNQLFAPNSEAAKEQSASNIDRRVFVESFAKAPNGIVPWYKNFGNDNGSGETDDYIRIDAKISGDGLVGPLSYSYNEYRIFVMNEANQSTFDHQGVDRSIEPTLTEDGDLRVASFNVLNYFTSPFGGNNNPLEQNRGAETWQEFEQQRAKIIAAIISLDADIVGLIEVENNGFDENSAIYDLVTELNLHLDAEKQYEIIVKEGVERIGTDAITNHAIYRPSVVSLEQFDIIELPQQHVELEDGSYKRAYQRDAVVPTFNVTNSNKSLTIAVNHFKSKGSTCWEDDQDGDDQDPDLQGSCENFRVSAAYHLAEQMARYDGYRIIMGDLNAYAAEDTLMVLTNRDNVPESYETWAARDTFIGGDETDGIPLHGSEGALIDTNYGYINVIQTLHP
ncbi:ExeM/NucH family extracellular endonuclease, partial [Vibrio sp. FNV 38]|nr:ExeM/NucH family extracellular endonuclease [Vibrio sp. FNV 38]